MLRTNRTVKRCLEVMETERETIKEWKKGLGIVGGGEKRIRGRG